MLYGDGGLAAIKFCGGKSMVLLHNEDGRQELCKHQEKMIDKKTV
jgi:hypothetical protein